MKRRDGTALGEDAHAGSRALFGLSLAVGGMAAASAALIGDGLAIVALPTLALAAALVLGSMRGAGYAAAAVWLIFAARVEGEGLLVPVAMLLLCLVPAVGPDRLAAWFDGAGHAADTASADPAVGWIEEV